MLWGSYERLLWDSYEVPVKFRWWADGSEHKQQQANCLADCLANGVRNQRELAGRSGNNIQCWISNLICVPERESRPFDQQPASRCAVLCSSAVHRLESVESVCLFEIVPVYILCPLSSVDMSPCLSTLEVPSKRKQPIKNCVSLSKSLFARAHLTPKPC